MMDDRKTTLERAFELAKSGRCKSTLEIRHALKAEGYVDTQIHGLYLMRQLRGLIAEANEPAGSVAAATNGSELARR